MTPTLIYHLANRHSANHSEVAVSPATERTAPLSLFRVIATDVHFWIPFAILVGGLLLLNQLR